MGNRERIGDNHGMSEAFDRRVFIGLGLPTLLLAQQQSVPSKEKSAVYPPSAVEQAVSDTPDDDALEYVCPMDKDIRSATPGKCPRCGMTLVKGIPEEHD